MTFFEQASEILEHSYAWDRKNNRAIEFESQDSYYRLWKPSSGNFVRGGIHMYAKVDHIRGGAKDDHAAIEMSFDSSGNLRNMKSEFEIQGRETIFDDVSDIIGELADISPKLQVAKAVGKATGKLYESVQKYTDKGGRLIFPSVVEGLINDLCSLVIFEASRNRTFLNFITSYDKPYTNIWTGKEEQHRSSTENFNIENETEVRVKVVGSNKYGWNETTSLKFDIMQDKFGRDSVLAENLENNSIITGLESDADYYIANPKYTNGRSPDGTKFVVGFFKNH